MIRTEIRLPDDTAEFAKNEAIHISNGYSVSSFVPSSKYSLALFRKSS